jgi:hypothetical protein
VEILSLGSTPWNTSLGCALHWKQEDSMHPAFWPMHAFIFWADFFMIPWKMMLEPVADSMKEAVAVTNPAAVAGLDPVSPKEIGTSATDFRADSGA